MNANFVDILGVQVSNQSEADNLEYIRKYLQGNKATRQQGNKVGRKPLVIFTPNPEIVVYSQKDKTFKKLVNTAQINLCDGWGLVWASQVLDKGKLTRITGVDFAEKLAELASKEAVAIGLIGGRPGIALKALERLRKKYPGLKGWVEEGPVIPKGLEKTAKTGLILVGLGCPKQEYFIDALQGYNVTKLQSSNGALLPCSSGAVLMAVGGAFDYWAGRTWRAPRWIQNLGLEWLWRLILQPWRLKRQLALLEFIFLVTKEKLAGSR